MESLCEAVIFVERLVVIVTTGGARGDAKCVAVQVGAGEAAERMDDSGGGAGVANRVADSVAS